MKGKELDTIDVVIDYREWFDQQVQERLERHLLTAVEELVPNIDLDVVQQEINRYFEDWARGVEITGVLVVDGGPEEDDHEGMIYNEYTKTWSWL